MLLGWKLCPSTQKDYGRQTWHRAFPCWGSNFSSTPCGSSTQTFSLVISVVVETLIRFPSLATFETWSLGIFDMSWFGASGFKNQLNKKSWVWIKRWYVSLILGHPCRHRHIGFIGATMMDAILANKASNYANYTSMVLN
jgi:hypothetical protein